MSRVRFFSMITPSLPASPITAVEAYEYRIIQNQHDSSKRLKFTKQHFPDGFLISQGQFPALVSRMTKTLIGSAQCSFYADKYWLASISNK